MRNILTPVLWLLSAVLLSCTQADRVSPREVISLNSDWKFRRGDVAGAEVADFNDAEWRKLDLPHDWSIEDLPGSESPLDSGAVGSFNTGFFVGGTGWYRKTFTLPASATHRMVWLYFEGVYMNSDVWINGQHLGNHPYGYTSFEYNLTPYINFQGENVIAVQVKNEGRNSRWYSGSGIYRHVRLKITHPTHIENWGVAITTPEVSERSARINIKTNIFSGPDVSGLTLKTTIFDQQDREVADISSTVTNKGDPILQGIELAGPMLWSIETPILYRARSSLFLDNEIVDQVENTFGIRSLSFSADKGFQLNGKTVLLKGGCLHHDNGPLGAAAYDRAEERKVELMKKNGYNAIRCAHNPPSKAFLDACDRLGIVVINEAFDMWADMKWDHADDYSRYFQDHWKKDIRSFIRRDINHPSIIMWSVGNEIPNMETPEVVATAEMLANEVRSLDTSRPVTAAANDLKTNKDPFFSKFEIAGLNYAVGGDHWKEDLYALDHERVPDRIMYCSESYPLHAFGSWLAVKKYPYVIGDFVWTAFDYLGESSIGWKGYWLKKDYYPWSQAYCGDIDICGGKRPQSYYRDVLWGNTLVPSVFIHPPGKPSFEMNEERMNWSKWHWHDVVDSWNWTGFEGETIRVDVYNSSASVELLLNDQSLGKQETSEANKWIATWQVPYTAGKLEAVSYNENNGIVGKQQLHTAGKARRLVLKADRDTLTTDQDLSYVNVELVDEHGIVNPTAGHLVSFKIEGPGTLAAVASANPTSTESFQRPHRRAFRGRCMLIVKTGSETGTINVTASAEGLESATLPLTVLNE